MALTPSNAAPVTTRSPTEDPLATTLFRSPVTNLDADVVMESPQHKPSISDAPQYEVTMGIALAGLARGAIAKHHAF